MRVNVYSEEQTDRVEIVSKEIDGQQFTGCRFYLELPVTLPDEEGAGARKSVSGPFIHRTSEDGRDDDDSSAVTFWGKRDLREMLRKALRLLDEHYGHAPAEAAMCWCCGEARPSIGVAVCLKCYDDPAHAHTPLPKGTIDPNAPSPAWLGVMPTVSLQISEQGRVLATCPKCQTEFALQAPR